MKIKYIIYTKEGKKKSVSLNQLKKMNNYKILFWVKEK